VNPVHLKKAGCDELLEKAGLTIGENGRIAALGGGMAICATEVAVGAAANGAYIFGVAAGKGAHDSLTGIARRGGHCCWGLCMITDSPSLPAILLKKVV
jgi:hypothetical protein